MALTVTKTTHPTTGEIKIALGGMYLVFGSIAFDSSYPTGGEPIAVADLGLTFGPSTLVELFTEFPTDGANFSTFDKANGKLKLFTADGVEAANASDQSAVVHRFMALVV